MRGGIEPRFSQTRTNSVSLKSKYGASQQFFLQNQSCLFESGNEFSPWFSAVGVQLRSVRDCLMDDLTDFCFLYIISSVTCRRAVWKPSSAKSFWHISFLKTINDEIILSTEHSRCPGDVSWTGTLSITHQKSEVPPKGLAVPLRTGMEASTGHPLPQHI